MSGIYGNLDYDRIRTELDGVALGTVLREYFATDASARRWIELYWYLVYIRQVSPDALEHWRERLCQLQTPAT